MDKFEKEQADFEKWQDQWAKAQEQGIFNDAEHMTTPSTRTADLSYFGPVNSNPTSDVRDTDAKYWQQVYAMSGHQGMAPDPLKAADQLIAEERAAKKVQEEIINEAVEAEVAKVTKAIIQSPNPVHAGTVGKDQDLTPQSLSATFTEEDIETLHELKIQLHNAQAVLIGHEIEGKATTGEESKIASLKEKIDALSTAMGQMFPLAVSPQGD
jgi:hypothetical protein